MPSIPQSLLWISLVVLWLFVLVPMLISKRDVVRRISDVALATRVLNGVAGARLLKRGGPATGHRSDHNWELDEDWRQNPVDGEFADADQDIGEEQDQNVDDTQRTRPVVMEVAVAELTGTDYLDVDVVEDSVALPIEDSADVTESVLLAVGEGGSPGEEAEAEQRQSDRYGYVDASSGLGLEQKDDKSPVPVAPTVSRQRRYDTKTATAVSARKYAFRKRVLMVMAIILVGSAAAAFEVDSNAWWICGSSTTVTVLYLAYLRRQTRIEEKVRSRRMHRIARARVDVENAHDREFDVVPSRLRRPGAVVLEIDDEDPIFEHLDYEMPIRTFGWPRDLPRAVGQ
ncbi:hypothetical protein JK2ML_0185 [Mycobacterium leprae Kyoto-2]|uniref:Membrane protein n=3 Tax=Mycobacterium leprae TaxID=1769 RepID=Q7AQM6_MYCLE|nr:gephyrin-like molybdotransferase receptor GlpR [Mycobacterium leprae]CAR70278.1 putative membrane protein [Mycobacterium leprae Br4923]AWV47170.1 hypothetical protein DIJ64_00980 [Mycobacterium leprae]OAR20138.1 hypothetical protein A8144_12020 [Mycobacterium leprae 3125609]OAX70245.1 hypothetical protein A3216_13115 [Mycobacterium leprae 7935681]CAB36699.1 putative membrane protein MLCB373.37 [Mycobacterium leprae]